MSSNKPDKVAPLKKVLNPKNRGNFRELQDLDLGTLTPREKDLLRVINDLEEQMDRREKIPKN